MCVTGLLPFKLSQRIGQKSGVSNKNVRMADIGTSAVSPANGAYEQRKGTNRLPPKNELILLAMSVFILRHGDS